MVAGGCGTEAGYAGGAPLTIWEPSPENIRLAAEILQQGGLVAMPTETVYGLACDATNPQAILKVFEAKGRPSDNPLIVHIARQEQLRDVCEEVPPLAWALVERFWPGPLTIVVPRGWRIPRVATAGLDTVAVRVPSHPTARALIEATGVPLAAPSANLSGRLSATRPEHLDPELVSRVDAILDGGPCEVGIESTVLDLTTDRPVVLRPGRISADALAECLGTEVGPPTEEDAHKSPGTHARHYAPRTPLRLVARLAADDAGLTFEVPSHSRQIRMASDPIAYEVRLYDALHELDALGLPELCAELPPDGEAWRAARDRLARASHP